MSAKPLSHKQILVCPYVAGFSLATILNSQQNPGQTSSVAAAAARPIAAAAAARPPTAAAGAGAGAPRPAAPSSESAQMKRMEMEIKAMQLKLKVAEAETKRFEAELELHKAKKPTEKHVETSQRLMEAQLAEIERKKAADAKAKEARSKQWFHKKAEIEALEAGLADLEKLLEEHIKKSDYNQQLADGGRASLQNVIHSLSAACMRPPHLRKPPLSHWEQQVEIHIPKYDKLAAEFSRKASVVRDMILDRKRKIASLKASLYGS